LEAEDEADAGGGDEESSIGEDADSAMVVPDEMIPQICVNGCMFSCSCLAAIIIMTVIMVARSRRRCELCARVKEEIVFVTVNMHRWVLYFQVASDFHQA
jgi:hypothetical protein